MHLKHSEHDVLNEIAHEVLAYLDVHPDAADTTEGIKKWWLMQRLAGYSHTRVQLALDRLEATRAIERRVLCNGREVYARPRRAGTVEP